MSDTPPYELNAREAADALAAEAGWQLVDVREAHERAAGHIAGSRHVEFARVAAEAASIDRDRPVLFYCRVGARSEMVTQAFRADGYDAYNLAGGIVAWGAAGLEVATGEG